MAIRHYVNQTTSAYVNDNWKVSSQAEPATRFALRCTAARVGTQQCTRELRSLAIPSTAPSLWSTTNSGRYRLEQPWSSDASRVWWSFLLPQRHGYPRDKRCASRGGNQRLQHGGSLASGSRTISPATARPFSAAASEPSTSACRATTSTALRITTCPMNTHRLRTAFTSAHQPARGNRRHPRPILRTAAVRRLFRSIRPAWTSWIQRTRLPAPPCTVSACNMN